MTSPYHARGDRRSNVTVATAPQALIPSLRAVFAPKAECVESGDCDTVHIYKLLVRKFAYWCLAIEEDRRGCRVGG